MSEFADRLTRRLAGLVTLNDGQIRLLQRHYDLMVRWNQRLNLSSVVDLAGAVDLHYAESLFLASLFPPVPLKVIDFGSGAGFPGVPAAVLQPHWDVYLAEARHKKAAFLREATSGIPTIHVEATEAQNLVRTFDLVIARAVNPQQVIQAALAPQIGLLLNHADAERLVTGAPHIEWREKATVPWRPDHVVLTGSCST
ncbi:MAG: class I SAM-dependent methyltransferase [Bryobacteraceae bacterium]|nr:class I SAM-dependent methyltransferase [Bryobacteraceae bacterium]